MATRVWTRAVAAVALVAAAATWPLPRAQADNYVRISGEGSTWAAYAINDMIANVKQFGVTVDYNGDGSSKGRTAYDNGDVDFAASDIPFQLHPEDKSAPDHPPPGYAYLPITAGGTSFIYNLKINGQRVVNLRLSGTNVAKIFTGVITSWSDPALKQDNPNLALPDRPIAPVVRSDGSGSTAFLTMWMKSQYPTLWSDYCKRLGISACGFTSFYPTIHTMISQAGDDGVTSYVTSSYAEGSIGYVNYSYAINSQFPVAKLLNTAGYYTEPTPEYVAVSLLQAQINQDKSSADYLTQKLDNVYTNPDPRNYPLSSYSYLIVPTQLLPPPSKFTKDKGKTLGFFGQYAMCQAQQHSATLGYSPMPINLVQAGFDQIRRIPGAVVDNVNIANCHNPTFKPDGTNALVDLAQNPPTCDKQGTTQCSTGTAGARSLSTPASAGTASSPAAGGGAGAGGAGTGSGSRATSGSGSGGTGTATSSTGKGSPGAGGAGTASGGAGATCDVDTCAVGLFPLSSGATQVGAATPTILSGTFGWSGKQLVLLVVVVLTLALVLAPAGAWLYLGRRR